MILFEKVWVLFMSRVCVRFSQPRAIFTHERVGLVSESMRVSRPVDTESLAFVGASIGENVVGERFTRSLFWRKCCDRMFTSASENPSEGVGLGWTFYSFARQCRLRRLCSLNAISLMCVRVSLGT